MRNSLLFDSGDLIQGNPLGDYVAVEQPLQPGQIHPVFKALNQLDYEPPFGQTGWWLPRGTVGRAQ